MSPSSLIFVAVVAIWATYLVVDATRRREHLATARTVDRFSAQMRVLQRRAVRRETAEAFEASTAPARGSSSVLLHRPPAATSARSSLSDTVEETAPAKPRRRLVVDARRVAAATLVAAVVLVVTGTLLALLGIATPILPVAALVVALADIAWLRSRVIRDRARRRRAATVRRRRAPAPATAAAREVAVAAAPPARRSDLVAPVVPAPVETFDPVEAAAPTPPAPESDLRPLAPAMPVAQEHVPFDEARYESGRQAVQAAREHAILLAEAEAAAAAVDLLDGEQGWHPVPVPPPTYTLKARAERPLPPPLEVPVALVDDVDDVDWDAPVIARAVGD